LYSIYAERGTLKFTAPQNGDCALLEGIEDSAIIEKAEKGEGVFVSFKFPTNSSLFDVRLGKLPAIGRSLAHSRIKRWWMAPDFHDSADSIPVETQSLLLEIDEFKRLKESLKIDRMSDNLASGLISAVSKTALHDSKMYAVIIPLIDYDRGFRVTLFGKEGGYPAGDGVLAARIESGDSSVFASEVSNALYVAAGSDPYQLMHDAYASIAQRMGTFRTRDQKPAPQWANLFGFCTWDAFYSSVDSEKVKRGVESLIDAGAPPGFVIIDDGWQSTGRASRDIDRERDRKDSKEQAAADIEAGEPNIVTVPEKNSGNADITRYGSGNADQYSSADGELSGAQIDGDVAADQLAKIESNPIMALVSKFFLKFYSECVEKGEPDSWAVKTWRTLARTVFKEKLIDFFEFQTDFSKRLTSWKANVKFEDASTGKSLKSFIRQLKGGLGVKYVYVWHALSGYWGGVSEDLNHDWSKALNVGEGEYAEDAPLEMGSASGGRSAILGYEQPTNYTGSVLSAASKIVGEALRTPRTPAAPVVQRTYANPTPHLLLVEPALAWDPSSLAGVGSVASERLEDMYTKMHSYLADAGVDGVKVDAQSAIGAFGEGRGGGSNLARACVSAMEKSVKAAFGTSPMPYPYTLTGLSGSRSGPAGMSSAGGDLVGDIMSEEGRDGVENGGAEELIAEGRSSNRNMNSVKSQMGLTGCMCHSTENLFSFYETSTIRASDDFYPKDDAAQTVHLVSCAYNGVMLGEIGVCDWDMFHSVHPYAEVHAAARAVSGGPVYVSDAPGKHDPELLRRLILPSGEVLRAQLPARPTPDCLFDDVMGDGKTALKVWSLNAHGAVAAVFNVQGASWDRKQRKYVSKPELRRVAVDARLRPRDIGRGYFDKQNIPRGSFIEPSRGDQMVVGWSARDRSTHLLRSRNDALEYRLKPKGWDVVSLFHVRAAGAVRRRTWGTFANEVSRKIGLTKTPLEKGKSRPADAMDSAVAADGDTGGRGGLPRAAVGNEDTNMYSQYFGDSRVYWAPIGLLNMLNAGGAIVSITEPTEALPRPAIPQLSSLTSATPLKHTYAHGAEFKVKGAGELGFYASVPPASVLINGIPVKTTWTQKGLDFGGLVTVRLAEDSEIVGAAKKLVQEALEPVTSTIGDPLELTSPLEDISTVSVYWD
jgi:hypothetical protein